MAGLCGMLNNLMLYNCSESYGVIMRKIWEAMDAEGRQWRSVYKALSLLEHLIKNGTERVIENARDHMFKLRHLSSFSYHDGMADRGNGGGRLLLSELCFD